ncbi:similar to Saccharomyces cerevisiae YNL287W SEC21 Gamma subunit of coatomer, a heptameric protein complex that together with Arf1p forms the COPI coat [Maudiozyma saulgeensis]|uniref:Coatomer subunit gamma n=1 Tax=Maudiozyma saulgeensis TaxID=1789683 RepID=A0A1X7R1X8_9SACH|nr:similar to Saccharomyces cerevisiae YNL287W SEC21 Gamma subunit of coatomer, a heptameric protein complex that together with Arf1p forms the COPI coat [Kazachstania saulgeensis]
MSTKTYKKFENAGSGDLPDKMTVYQDCMNTFNESPVNPKRCRILISRLLRLLSNGVAFPENEATALFFSISKLFQHQNDALRQVVYLAIKELSGMSEDVLMATSSIMKDVQNGSDLVKPNAIRALTYVLDESTAFSAERLLKSAVVSKHPAISSAALCTSYNLLPISEVTIKRFANEAQEGISDLKQFPNIPYDEHSLLVGEFYPNSSYMAQYHAIGLIYQLKKNDKMAILKLASQLADSNTLKNQLAKVQVVKLIADLINRDPQLFNEFQSVLFAWLTTKHEAVQIEVAKVISTFALRNQRLVAPDSFAYVVSTLQALLTVPRVSTRFAVLRILNKIAMVAPERIALCNPELETLINDTNRNISTYAITILLKTGNASNIASLISRISRFFHDVSDDFKIIIIDAVRTLSLNFPQEWKSIVKFLMDVLKNSEGGLKFKNTVVEAIIDIVSFIPESKELILENLCDFIEDCEFNEILVRILHLLGKEGPYTSKPSLYVRHIYNRVVLENSIIRSAAVVALAKFALTKNDPTLKESIVSLLNRIANDQDDEVRDRATIALRLIESADGDNTNVATELIEPKYFYDLPSLESKLSNYLNTNDDSFKTAFDSSSVRRFTEDEVKAIELKRKQEQSLGATSESSTEAGTKKSKLNDKTENNVFGGSSVGEDEQELLNAKYAEELLAIDQFKEYGKLINSSKSVSLTETEAEFVVNGIKHIFKDYIVLQFNITNTLPDVALTNVSVSCTQEDAETSQLEELFSIAIDKLLPTEVGACYVAFQKTDNLVIEGFLNNLIFTTVDINPDTNEPYEGEEGFQDEYEIDSLYINAGDYVTGSFIGNFDTAFDELPAEEIAVFNIQENLSLQEVIDKIITNSNCLPLNNTQFAPSDSNSHVLKLFGKSVLSGSKVALLIKMIHSSKGIALKVQGKGEDATLCSDLVNGLM